LDGAGVSLSMGDRFQAAALVDVQPPVRIKRGAGHEVGQVRCQEQARRPGGSWLGSVFILATKALIDWKIEESGVTGLGGRIAKADI
jgi:hypothetical protein